MNANEILNGVTTDIGVFKPDSGSIALAEACLNYRGRFLDVGTGTGFISLVLFLNGYEGEACDISPAALNCARDNFKRFGIESEPFLSDLLSNVKGKFDIIAFNPATSPGESGFSRFQKNFLKSIFPSFVLFPLKKIFWKFNSDKRRSFLNDFLGCSKKYLNGQGVLLLNILGSDLKNLTADNQDAAVTEIYSTGITKIVEVKFL